MKYPDLLQASIQQAPPADAYADPSLIAKFDVNTLSVGDVADFSDTSSSYNFSTVASANNPTVTLRGDGDKQLEFDSSNSETMMMDSNYAALDLDPTGDFTIVVAFGDITPANSGSVITKGQFWDYQFGLFTGTTGDTLFAKVGNTQTNLSGQRVNVPDAVLVIRHDSNGTDYIMDNIEINSNVSTGSSTFTESWQLAGRANLVNSLNNVAFKRIAFYSSYLNDTKLTEIYNQEQNI